jgi:nucleoside-diphosphate-sugar epimerase
MKCELYLRRVRPLPFVCLRLPDVIGPYDNTERFWCTVRWIRESGKYPMPITADEENIKLSFVDSLSVAAQIVKLITLEEVPS